MTDTTLVHAEDLALQRARDDHRSQAARLADTAATAEIAGDGDRAAWLRGQAADLNRTADTEDRQLQANQQRRRAASAYIVAYRRPVLSPDTLSR